jgi:ATP-binding cassette subfamily C (CFTR/MRP) protein 10
VRGDFKAAIDLHQICQYNSIVANQWLAISLQFAGVSIVGGIAFSSVALIGSSILADEARVGLILSYALPLTAILQGTVTSFVDTEREMVALERVGEYLEVPSEAKPGDDSNGLRNRPFMFLNELSSPVAPEIEFRNVTMRYGSTLALDRISMRIPAGKRTAICGRTGSGKSSLLAALFRTHEIASGTVLVGGIDSALVELHTLR